MYIAPDSESTLYAALLLVGLWHQHLLTAKMHQLAAFLYALCLLGATLLFFLPMGLSSSDLLRCLLPGIFFYAILWALGCMHPGNSLQASASGGMVLPLGIFVPPVVLCVAVLIMPVVFIDHAKRYGGLLNLGVLLYMPLICSGVLLLLIAGLYRGQYMWIALLGAIEGGNAVPPEIAVPEMNGMHLFLWPLLFILLALGARLVVGRMGWPDLACLLMGGSLWFLRTCHEKFLQVDELSFFTMMLCGGAFLFTGIQAKGFWRNALLVMSLLVTAYFCYWQNMGFWG